MNGNFFSCVFAYLKRAWKELLAILIVVAVDLVSKSVVAANMKEGQVVSLIPGFFSFKFSYNDKAAYSFAFGLDKLLTQDQLINFFIITTVAAMLAFAFVLWYFRKCNFLSRLSVAMIMGGAIGNLVDRIVYRKVRDFLCITVFGKDIFGSFNVADAALCIGVVLFAVYILFYFDKDSKALEKIKKAAQAENQPVAQTVGDGAALEENREDKTNNGETVNKTENIEVVEENKTDGNNETDA